MKKQINEQIQANEVYVIDPEGEILWPLRLEKAIEKAESLGQDLVEVGVREKVVVAKIMNYGKHIFREQKKTSKNRTKSKKAEPKTLRLTYAMSEHDLQVRANQAIKFAQKGYPLKVILMLRRRENQHAEHGREQVEKFTRLIEKIYEPEWKIMKTGNTFSCSFRRIQGQKENNY